MLSASFDIDDGFKTGERFKYLESVTRYARQYVAENYIEDFCASYNPIPFAKG